MAPTESRRDIQGALPSREDSALAAGVGMIEEIAHDKSHAIGQTMGRNSCASGRPSNAIGPLRDGTPTALSRQTLDHLGRRRDGVGTAVADEGQKAGPRHPRRP